MAMLKIPALCNRNGEERMNFRNDIREVAIGFGECLDVGETKNIMLQVTYSQRVLFFLMKTSHVSLT